MNNANLYLSPECLGTIILVSVSPDYYGLDKERHAEIQGYKYEVMLPQHRYDKLVIKILGAQLMDSPISGNEPQVTFEGLRVRPYVDRTGRMAYTASATGVKSVADDKPKPAKA